MSTENTKQNENMQSSKILNPTYGQKAVGINFNPSGDDAVGQVKQKFADLIDAANEFRNQSGSNDAKRHASVAITEMESAQMRFEKALNWKD